MSCGFRYYTISDPGVDLIISVNLIRSQLTPKRVVNSMDRVVTINII